MADEDEKAFHYGDPVINAGRKLADPWPATPDRADSEPGSKQISPPIPWRTSAKCSISEVCGVHPERVCYDVGI